MRNVPDKGATGNKRWQKEFQELVEGIVEQVRNQMSAKKFNPGQVILQIQTDPRFLRADIINGLSADPNFKELGCSAESLYEDYIIFKIPCDMPT